MTQPSTESEATEQGAPELDPLAAALLERDEQIAAHQRTAADFANFRRRTAEEREREAGLASESLLIKALAVADDMDRALAAAQPVPDGLFRFLDILREAEVSRTQLHAPTSQERQFPFTWYENPTP